MKVFGIKRSTLKMALEIAKDNYPNEFAALMRAVDGLIVELIFIPGTVGGERSAMIPFHMKPVDFSIVGVLHSHPSTYPYPSKADLALFDRYGDVHIIVARPYTMDSWKAWDRMGNEVKLEVV